MNNRVEAAQFADLFLNDTPLIDVRAQVEFKQGSLPGAVNLPILNDEERALIGTTYKQKGQEEAVRLGYQIVSGSVKQDRVHLWSEFIRQNPKTVLYCFRGGKRSQITQQWLKEAGIDRPIITGGYKAVRTFLIEQIERFCVEYNFVVVTGPTGSGKTRFLAKLGDRQATVDLEKLARHRGSAFGAMDVPQPSQIDFENTLAAGMLKLENQYAPSVPIFVEDESRLIGSCGLPMTLFEKIRSSSVLWIDEPFENRVQNIFEDYILNSSIGTAVQSIPRCAEEETILRDEALRLFARYQKAVTNINRKLGGLRAQEVLADLDVAQTSFLTNGDLEANRVWIEKLLTWYYDPMYLGSLDKRNPKILYKGDVESCLNFAIALPR